MPGKSLCRLEILIRSPTVSYWPYHVTDLYTMPVDSYWSNDIAIPDDNDESAYRLSNTSCVICRSAKVPEIRPRARSRRWRSEWLIKQETVFMLSTKSAQSLRKLFASYHEPPPLSRRSSQKLLDGLKSSFRAQLDREYGPASESADTASSAPTTVQGADTRLSAASHHLKSILANPLFSYPRHIPGQNPPASPLLGTKRDPMDVFEHAVAKGLMTLKAATGCIVAKRALLLASEPNAGISSSETAARVLRWLRSSRAEAELKFLDNQHFVRALTPFLIAEGLEGVAWEWITRSVTDRLAPWSDALRIKRVSCVLAEMVRIKSQPQYGDLDAAISTILDAEQRFHSSPLLPDLLILPWRSVSWLSTVEACNQATPTEKLFNAHLATADLFPKSFAVERAHLNLHHPTRPDHSAALRFSDRSGLRKLIQSFRPLETNMSRWTGMSMISWISVLGQDTVNHLARLGRRREAEDVTELLHSELPPRHLPASGIT